MLHDAEERHALRATRARRDVADRLLRGRLLVRELRELEVERLGERELAVAPRLADLDLLLGLLAREVLEPVSRRVVDLGDAAREELRHLEALLLGGRDDHRAEITGEVIRVFWF